MSGSALIPLPSEAGAARHASGASRDPLAGGRWHFQHGPIDLVVAADGDPHAVAAALERLWARFPHVLPELVTELALLRSPVQEARGVRGPVAQRMVAACAPHGERFITPMAAVAGAVADELIHCFACDARIARAYVNNGGDIALHLQPGERYRIGVFADLARASARRPLLLDGEVDLDASLPVRGIATSGWRGRSLSLGIADSVTVLAADAAAADAAATMVANSVDVDDPAILRQPACELKDDSDLGNRLVAVQVGTLAPHLVEEALDRGARCAQELIARGLIHCAALWLQGRVRLVERGEMRITTKQAQ